MPTPVSVTPSDDALKGNQTPRYGGPVLGLAEAAKACGVSVSTLRRKRSDLEALGATTTPSGWRIPIGALVRAGLMPATTPPPHSTPDATPLIWGGDAPSDALREELDTLRSQLAAAERRAAVAEAIASERERLIQTQAMALRMLESPAATADTTPAGSIDQPPPTPQAQPFSRPSLWQRIRGVSATS